MPREHFGPGFRFLPRAEILTFEEVARLARVFASLGVRKLRLTGGEPLLRAELPKLVAMLSEIPDVDIALTTNGSLLATHARALADAGLDRVTVSLDSLDPKIFQKMTDSGDSVTVADVLAGIEAADAAGLRPVKINCVVRRGVNDHTVLDLARHFKGTGRIVRFIEYMDVGATNGWRLDQVVSGREIVERIGSALPLEAATATHPGEVAKRWRYVDGTGEIGVITSVTEAFCGDCVRARLSAEGALYTCLFARTGTDLRAPLRAGADDAELAAIVENTWRARDDRYSELRRSDDKPRRRIEMSYIGG
jgi:cyclic pyranopterin phosphate synthase